MGNIILLDENTSNKIAAGEVVEKPASVVKELVENSIDAGAGSIIVEIKNGGITLIKITDNGSGIDEDDVEIAFERHATSKIRGSKDLDAITTLGFRGEALASIAAVSSVQLITRTKKNSHGIYLEIQGGSIIAVRQTGCPIGTVIAVKDLFYNTPARFKFLKKDNTEAGYISDIMNRVALGNPNISFKLISNNTTVIHTPGNNDLLSAIFSIYGRDTAKCVSEVNYTDNKMKITGYAGKQDIARANRNSQSFFINGRYIKSRIISSAVDEAYKTYLMKNKYAFIVLNIDVNPLLVDVNVHPGKMEVRFSNEQDVFRSVYNAVSNALLCKTDIRTIQLESRNEETYKIQEKKFDRVKYDQQNLNLENGYIKEEVRATCARESMENKQAIINKEKELLPDIANALAKTHKVIFSESDDIEREADIPSALHENLLSGVRIIGQVFSTYILLQKNDELLLIDQHAAHERIMYEDIKRKFLNNEPLAQMLVNPAVIEVTHQEMKALEDRKEFFIKIGFIYENFGNNSIILRSVPYFEQNNSVREVFLDVVDFVMCSSKPDYNIIADDTLYTIACKAAVKANMKLDNKEIDNIINALSYIENPYTCPHGRPTIIKIIKHELEKMFKRIQ